MAILEICAADIDSARNAAEGGAQRIELCSGLEIGGVTPSLGLIKEAVAIPGLKVNVLIRPRGGDFVYTDAELRVMEADIAAACLCGVNGVVIGALHPDGSINVEATRRMAAIARAQGVEVVFHRAFDRSADLSAALEQLIEIGCDRVLSSGGHPTAMEGIDVLAKLNKQAAGRISIMPGAGVKVENVEQILRTTGAHEVHSSAKTARPSVGSDAALRNKAEGACFITSVPEVKAIKEIVNRF